MRSFTNNRVMTTNLTQAITDRREVAWAGDCMHFNSHIDMVAVGRDWTVDPFGGGLIDGKIYGRGASDMKFGLAKILMP
ncbi:MAG: M20/M25/M40 family metallo-hydrolase [Yoonia sp.]|nr:M20/M25/M40 family metallo-hydrolase [Yoonia sp.]